MSDIDTLGESGLTPREWLEECDRAEHPCTHPPGACASCGEAERVRRRYLPLALPVAIVVRSRQ